MRCSLIGFIQGVNYKNKEENRPTPYTAIFAYGERYICYANVEGDTFALDFKDSSATPQNDRQSGALQRRKKKEMVVAKRSFAFFIIWNFEC